MQCFYLQDLIDEGFAHLASVCMHFSFNQIQLCTENIMAYIHAFKKSTGFHLSIIPSILP